MEKYKIEVYHGHYLDSNDRLECVNESFEESDLEKALKKGKEIVEDVKIRTGCYTPRLHNIVAARVCEEKSSKWHVLFDYNELFKEKTPLYQHELQF